MLDKLFLVRYDVRGHGRSGKPIHAEGYASALYAADFSAVAKEFCLNMPVFAGWSAGAPICSDICSYMSPVPLCGVIAMSGALCVATASKTLKPKLVEMLPKFCSSDAATALNTRVEFIDAVFADPSNVPSGHKPDQSKLVELGAQGFPAMILYGTDDQIQDGRVVTAEARPYFTDLEVVPIQGGSHSVFYDNLDETVDHILSFCLRVNGQLLNLALTTTVGRMPEHLLVILAYADSREHLKVDWQHIAETLRKFQWYITLPTIMHHTFSVFLRHRFPNHPARMLRDWTPSGSSLGENLDIRLYETLPLGARITVPTSPESIIWF
ncbi:Alpha/Beta hydrolase protein [Mycena leptocephala]|nr:Alpha/Beta hydrolase protein [Mycena leptocephala]